MINITHSIIDSTPFPRKQMLNPWTCLFCPEGEEYHKFQHPLSRSPPPPFFFPGVCWGGGGKGPFSIPPNRGSRFSQIPHSPFGGFSVLCLPGGGGVLRFPGFIYSTLYFFLRGRGGEILRILFFYILTTPHWGGLRVGLFR